MLIFWCKAEPFLWTQFCWMGLNCNYNLWFPSVSISLVWNTNLKILSNNLIAEFLSFFILTLIFMVVFPMPNWTVFFTFKFCYMITKRYIILCTNSKSTEIYSLDNEGPRNKKFSRWPSTDMVWFLSPSRIVYVLI